MSILIDKSTRLIVQGITGRDGLFHARKMKEYGTNVVGGTSPGKGGTDANGIPVFNTMYEAVEQTQANTSIIFVPARFAADAIMEAADAGIRLIVCIAEGIPTLDVIKAHQFIKQKGAILVGPNCPGLISPGIEHHVGVGELRQALHLLKRGVGQAHDRRVGRGHEARVEVVAGIALGLVVRAVRHSERHVGNVAQSVAILAVEVLRIDHERFERCSDGIRRGWVVVAHAEERHRNIGDRRHLAC